MRENPKPFEIYKHFKGNLYQILSIAEHSETGEQLVIYQALYGDFKVYARELSMFLSPVDKNKYPNAAQEMRFELQVKNQGTQPVAEAASVTGATVKETAAPVAGIVTKEFPASAIVGETKPTFRAEDNMKTEENMKTEDNVKTEEKAKTEDNSDESGLDPMLIRFLDADSYDEKLNILTGVRHRITKEMLTTMAVASDIEIKEGSIDEQYDSLRQCLLTLQKYECNRLR